MNLEQKIMYRFVNYLFIQLYRKYAYVFTREAIIRDGE